MGIFTTGARVLSARDSARAEAEERERIRQREEDERAQAEEERQIRHALLLGQLEQSHVVPNAQRDQMTVGGSPDSKTMAVRPTDVKTAMPMRETPDLVRSSGTVAQPKSEIHTRVGGMERMDVAGTPAQDVVDPRRYEELGKTGYSLDKNPGPSIAEQRAKALQQTKLNQRIAALKAKHPERYGKMDEPSLQGIASDDDAYREALKDVKPDTSPTFVQDGSMRWDPTANGGKGALVPTGVKARPRTTGTGGPLAGEKNDRDALQDRIGIVSQQITQIQAAQKEAPFVAARDTSESANKQRAANTTLQNRLAELRKEQADLTKELDRYSPTASGTTPPWAKGIKLSPEGAPEGIDMTLADGASQNDRDQAAAALARVGKLYRGKEVTMADVFQSPYLSPAAKAIAWRTKVTADNDRAVPPVAR